MLSFKWKCLFVFIVILFAGCNTVPHAEIEFFIPEQVSNNENYQMESIKTDFENFDPEEVEEFRKQLYSIPNTHFIKSIKVYGHPEAQTSPLIELRPDRLLIEAGIAPEPEKGPSILEEVTADALWWWLMAGAGMAVIGVLVSIFVNRKDGILLIGGGIVMFFLAQGFSHPWAPAVGLLSVVIIVAYKIYHRFKYGKTDSNNRNKQKTKNIKKGNNKFVDMIARFNPFKPKGSK